MILKHISELHQGAGLFFHLTFTTAFIYLSTLFITIGDFMKYLTALVLLTSLFVFTSCEKEKEEPKANTEQAPSGFRTVEAIETMNASNYTYINVEENGKEYWIAVPQMEVKAGEKLFFSKSMEMKNFKSESLNRTFETILFVEDIKKEMPSNQMNQPHPTVTTSKEEIKVEKPKDGYSIGEVFGGMNKMNGKNIKVKGKIVKYNPGIMGTNWIHIQDGTAHNEDFDLLVTSDTDVQVGQIITAQGKLITNKDFGSGYKYKALIENAKISIEK